jgi:hypothetical protein
MRSLLIFILSVSWSISSAQPPQPHFLKVGGILDVSGTSPVMIGGENYDHLDTADFDCGVDSLIVSIPIGYTHTGPVPVMWTCSPHFQLIDTGLDAVKILRLSSTRRDGFVTALYIYPGSPPIAGPGITLLIKQQIPHPTLTLSSNVCAGNSATFSATTDYQFQSTKPMNLVWTTTGGATVNTSTIVTQTSTYGSVTIANSSTGTYSIRAVVPSCDNRQSEIVAGHLGKPTDQVTFQDSTLSFQTSASSFNYAYGPTQILWNEFQLAYEGVTSNISWNASPDIGYALGTLNQTYSVDLTPGTTFTISPTATNVCGTTTAGPKTFTRPAFLVAYPNPVFEELSISFTDDASKESLPIKLALTSYDTSTPIFEILSSNGSIYKDSGGSIIKMDMSKLPVGIYYLHSYHEGKNKPQIHKIVKGVH